MKPSTIEQVAQFHAAFNVSTASKPYVTNTPLCKLRIALLREELQELENALADGDPVETLDALTDLQYVLDGAYLAFGFADVKDAAFAEVQRSNLSKLGADGKPILREDGKILKGPNYSPANLAQFID